MSQSHQNTSASSLVRRTIQAITVLALSGFVIIPLLRSRRRRRRAERDVTPPTIGE